MIDRAVVASKNPDKIAEIERLLFGVVGEIVTGLEWPDVDETADSLAGNALLKAQAVYAATGLPAIGDDTGLFVEALDSQPGVHTARYAGENATYEDNVTKLLSELDEKSERGAEFRTAVCLVDGSREIVVEGILPGRITRVRRGNLGFGYDPVFEVDGRTLGEIGLAEKNRMSHRARAFEALAEALRD